MAMVITTNAASINAQKYLSESRQDLDVAMERLSSGQRINSAADDAAGLAIRDKMTSQIEGLNQGVRNANDSISFMQTAEGALAETTNILQRMRTLAVQAVNDTNSSSDRVNLNDEIGKLIEEMNRIGNNSSFNDKILLDGSMTSSTFQIGHKSGQTIDISLNDMRASAIGDKTAVAAITAATTSNSAITLDGALQTGDVATLTIAEGVSVAITGVSAGGTNDTSTATLLATAIAAATDPTGYTMSSSGAVLTVTSIATGSTTSFTPTMVVTDTSGDATATLPGGTATATNTAGLDIAAGLAELETVANIDVLNKTTAAAAINTLDQALLEVGQERSKLGAFQNRLQFAVNNMTNMSANTSAARSVIADADYAQESSSLAKNQILQQAGTAMLAQANAQAQSVLSLLK
ncbi:flagellin [uncultured Paraglaciecola sp.]|uniref:flagellin N-terminal helical domain-containing protein n=1 Tax=uncultured Paraglaciecola sp. TaxID=1765024 RepID=UPI0025D4F24A|nr:flagellin [uncultured Paraglaciecola sp.]